MGTVSYTAPTSATLAHRCRRGLLAVMLLAVVAPHPPTLEAQIVRGQVINALSLQAVPQATVLLLRGERGDTVAGSLD